MPSRISSLGALRVYIGALAVAMLGHVGSISMAKTMVEIVMVAEG